MVIGKAILWLLGMERTAEPELAKLAFNPVLGVAVLLSLAVNGGVALWLGFQDMLWPVSLSSQLLGVTYVSAGLISLYGAANTVLLMVRAGRDPVRDLVRHGHGPTAISSLQESSARSLKSVALAAVVGLYVDVTIVLYSFRYFRYEAVKVLLFAVLALICVGLSRITLPLLWGDLGKGLKAAGISLIALAGLAQFWYQSVRLPSDAPAGMDYTVSLGPATRSGSDTLVQVNLSAEDTGTVPAVALASMVVVRGIVSPDGSTTPILRIAPLINDGSFFFPGDTFSEELFVRISNPHVESLSVDIQVDFARTTWLTLDKAEGLRKCSDANGKLSCVAQPDGLQECTKLPTGERRCTSLRVLTCPRDVLYQWTAAESALRRFTQGSRMVDSQWDCSGWNDINSGVDAWVTPDLTPAGSYLGILHSTRYEQLLLPKAQ